MKHLLIISAYDGWRQLKETRQTMHDNRQVLSSYAYHPNGLPHYSLVGIRRTTYEYDEHFRVKKISLNTGEHMQELEYNAFGRITNVRDWAGNGMSFDTQTRYDALGRVSEEVYPSGYTVLYAYGAMGDLVKVSDGNRRTVWEAVESNALGQWQTVKHGNASVQYTYDARHQPSRMWVGTGSGFDLRYAFNPETGQLISYTDWVKDSKET